MKGITMYWSADTRIFSVRVTCLLLNLVIFLYENDRGIYRHVDVLWLIYKHCCRPASNDPFLMHFVYFTRLFNVLRFENLSKILYNIEISLIYNALTELSTRIKVEMCSCENKRLKWNSEIYLCKQCRKRDQETAFIHTVLSIFVTDLALYRLNL